MAMGVGEIGTVWVNPNFGGDQNDFQNDPKFSADDSAIHMGEMVTGKPAMRTFSEVVSHILVGGLIISLLSGSYFKSVLYRGIFEGKFWDRPINVLLLVGAVIHHSTHLFYGISLIVTIGFDVSLGDIFGTFYCEIELFILVFGIGYLSIGSLGIAIYRIIYLRHNHWAKYVVGEKLLLGIIFVGSLMVTTLLATLFVMETTSKRPVFNGCVGQSELVQSMLIEIKKSQGRLGIYF